ACLAAYGFWLRSIHLTDLFDAWYFDEIDVFGDILDQVRGHAAHTPYAINHWHDRLMLFEFSGVYLFRLFGTSDAVMAVYPVIWATAAIPLTYLLGRELGFATPTSFLAAGLLATSLWHIEISRLLYDDGATATLALALCWMVVAMLRRSSLLLAALAGLTA